MKLRGKTLVAFAVLFLSVLAAISLISKVILMKSFESLEAHTVRQEAKRGYNAIAREVKFLSTMTGDWALWDDTYEYMSDRNKEYESSNLVDTSFKDLELNAILLVHPSGELHYKGGFDLEDEKQVPAPESLLSLLRPGSLLLEHSESESSSVEGILMLPEGPMLIASRPVLTSKYTGPINGVLIMGRFLTHDNLEEIARSGEFSLQMTTYSGSHMEEGFREARASLDAGENIHVQSLDKDRIAAYTLISDISGEPALILRADMLKSITATGKTTIAYFLSAILGLGILSALIIWVLLDMFVLSKVSSLNDRIANIIKTGEHSARVPVKGRDEIASLAQFINRMLASLEKSGKEFNRETLRSIGSRIAVLNRKGVVVFSNDPWTDPVFQDRLFGHAHLSIGDDLGKAFREFRGTLEAGDVTELQDVIAGQRPDCSMEITVPGTPAPFWYQLEATSFSGRGGGAVAAITDITARKHTESRLLDSLHEKELLLKEIHHRVKNNLQIISSILHMKEESTSSLEVAEALRANRNRLYSMALVHEKLYESESISKVDLKEYLESLVKRIHQSYDTGGITIEVNADPITLSLDQLIPCGILLNELITNSVKYAFKDTGTIRVRATLRDDKTVELSVKDNGPGLPEGLDIYDSESLGFILISSLTEQLMGTLDYRNENGALFVIYFPKELPSGD